jgi:RNase P subunit RPR2
MYSIYQLYCMNEMKTPFLIKRNTWGNMTVTVDLVDNFHFSAKDWRCDAYTKDEMYTDFGYGTSIRGNDVFKLIGCGGNYSWLFANKSHDENLIRPYRESTKPKSQNGLTIQKAGKNYTCKYCNASIIKGNAYEKYQVRNAGKLGAIKEIFCVGCRDKLREFHFQKPASEIKFAEILIAWNNGVLV